MDRYDEVKHLLKTWEAEFWKEHKRKPNKVDVDGAAEETQNLYREFRNLRQGRLSAAPAVCAENMTEESKSWGTHLNRSSVTQKMTSNERDSLKASAQYYGMKLKSNLGGSVKERSFSLTKSFTPCTPVDASKDEAAKGSSSSWTAAPVPTMNASPEDLPVSNKASSSLSPGILPHKLSLSSSSPGTLGNKLHQLQTRVGQRMASLNQDWLRRCDLRQREEQCHFMGNGEPQDVKEHWKPMVETEKEADGRTDLYLNRELRSSESFGENESPSPGVILDIRDKTEGRRNMCEDMAEEDWLITKKVKERDNNTRTRDHISSDCQSNTQETSDTIPEKYRRSIGEGTDKERTGKATKHLPNTEAISLSHPSKESSLGDRCREQGEAVGVSTECSRSGTKPQECRGNKQQKGASQRKRCREIITDSDSEGSLAVSCTKMSKTKLTTEKQRNKRPSKKAKVSEENVQECGKVTENLLGDVLEEEAARRAPTQKRMPQRPTENFVRINLKKKSHVKGFALNGSRLRKQMWKQKWQKKGEQFGGGGKHFNHSEDVCFRCGVTGHWATHCPGKAVPAPLPQASDAAEEEITLPTLEDVARMTNTQLRTTRTGRSLQKEARHSQDETKSWRNGSLQESPVTVTARLDGAYRRSPVTAKMRQTAAAGRSLQKKPRHSQDEKLDGAYKKEAPSQSG
ncbi:uncharacterized protein LOC134983045 [Pseudophryne corroboree]|uniref:uncharacterized protein LOC134983045 n=1 Tax=Pseudophryne corroboree TaxID=495146 RepID=UPI00308163BB